MRGIEPLSEILSTGTSPGADSDLKFPFVRDPLSDLHAGSFMVTTDEQSFSSEVSLFDL